MRAPSTWSQKGIIFARACQQDANFNSLLVAMIDWDLGPQAAAGLANFGSRGAQLEIEKGTEAAMLTSGLMALGHDVRIDEMTSGLHIIMKRSGRLLGGADPRREGVARGD